MKNILDVKTLFGGQSTKDQESIVEAIEVIDLIDASINEQIKISKILKDDLKKRSENKDSEMEDRLNSPTKNLHEIDLLHMEVVFMKKMLMETEAEHQQLIKRKLYLEGAKNILEEGLKTVQEKYEENKGTGNQSN